MMRSLRARLLMGTVLAVALLLAGFGGLVYALASRSFQGELDGALTATARALAAAVEWDNGRIEMELDPAKMPEFQEAGRSYFQYRTADGVSVLRSPSLGTADLPPLTGPPNEPVFADSDLPANVPGRAVAIRFMPHVGDDHSTTTIGPLTVVVARDTAALRARLSMLRWVLLSSGVAAVVAAVVVAAVVTRQGLRPLGRLATQIEAVRADDLTGRIAPGPMPTELQPVRERLNDLLGRLAAAFDRERAFTSDAAHELRTPLAGMRSTIEVAAARERSGPEYRQAMSESLDIVISMQAMVESLLLLARLEGRQVTPSQEPTNLPELLDAAWAEVAAAARDRGIEVQRDMPAGLVSRADGDLVRMILGNLLDNAVTHAADGGRVSLTGRIEGDRAVLRVANTGCTLSVEDVSRVFDNFWRGDVARTKTGVHAGLGLPLVKRAAETMGGSVTAAVEEGGWFVAHVMLPA